MAQELQWNIKEPGAWENDSAHFPTPLTPYHAEILKSEFPRGFREGSGRVGLLLSHFDHEIVNGFDYLCPRPVGAPKGAKGLPPRFLFSLMMKLHPEMRRRLKTAASAFETRPWRRDMQTWAGEIRPQSTRTHLALQARDPAGLDLPGLMALLEDLHRNAHHQYYLHHYFTVSSMLPVGDFIVQVREWAGLGTGELLQVCRQPKGVATVAQEQFDAAASAAAADPAARRLLESQGPADEAINALSTLPGATGEAVRAWIEMTGNRLVTGYDICDMTAIEMPALLLRTLRTAALDEGSKKASEASRAEALAKVRDRVPQAKRAQFDAVLAEALSVSQLREERALVCDFWAYGLVRRAVWDAGRRLAAQGSIQDAAHLFDASHAEMLALLGGRGGPTASDLAARHAYRTTATCEIAPKRLGFPPSPPPPESWLPPAVHRLNRVVEAVVEALFSEPEPRSEPKSVRGLNASAGRYEGRARVVLRPEDFGRIQRGDVLVARMTTEAYNGVMPLLGAVVTDRGGLLSHTATVAREFGIPAVVGTTDATRIIPDGARVVVDGSRGEARLV